MEARSITSKQSTKSATPLSRAADGFEATGAETKNSIFRMLIESGAISTTDLGAALKLLKRVRHDEIDFEQSVDELRKLHAKGVSSQNQLRPDFKQGAAPVKKGKSAPQDMAKLIEQRAIFELLKKAGLITMTDLEAAWLVRCKQGGDMLVILKTAKKLDGLTYTAAVACRNLMRDGRMKIEECVIALQYCNRSRSTLPQAFTELGWTKLLQLAS